MSEAHFDERGARGDRVGGGRSRRHASEPRVGVGEGHDATGGGVEASGASKGGDVVLLSRSLTQSRRG